MLTSDAEHALRETVRSIAAAALSGGGGDSGISGDWNGVRERIRETVEQELAAAVNAHNARAPLMRLREEELALVFGFLSFDRLLEVMVVCRRWYHTIVTSPRLWNDLCFPAGHPSPTPQTLSRFLDGSRAAPLVLMFSFPPDQDTAACAAYWRAIGQHMQHMSRGMIDLGSRLVTTWDARDVDAALTRAAPRLETLGLAFARTKPYDIPDSFLNGSPGALENLQLWNVNFPAVIPSAWANLTEILYAAPEVRRSGVLAMYACCPRLAAVTLSVVQYRLDCEGDAAVAPSIVSLRVMGTLAPDETLALLADAQHERVPLVMYKNRPGHTPPFWPAISTHRYTRTSLLAYLTQDELAQLEFATDTGGRVRQTLRVAAQDVWAALSDAAFLAHLRELEIAEEFWPMTRLPEAPALHTLTLVVGPRAAKFDMSQFRSNFLWTVSGKQLGRLVCPKLRAVVFTVPTRIVEFESAAALPDLPPLRGDVVYRFLDKLSTGKKLEEVVFKGLTVDDQSAFSFKAEAVRYEEPRMQHREPLPGGVSHAVSSYMSPGESA